MTGPNWGLHDGRLKVWLRQEPARREWQGTPVYAAGEHADRFVRQYLTLHGLEEWVQVNSHACFVALSVAEMMCVALARAMDTLALPTETQHALNATVVGAMNRLFWRAAHHAFHVDEAEPYGPHVHNDDLPPLDVADTDIPEAEK